MSQDCPHNRCKYFLTNGDAPCPACGRLPQRWSSHAWFGFAAAALLGVLLIALGTAGWWLVGILVLLAAGVGSAMMCWRSLTMPRFVTLDERYQQAVDESAHWLTKWIELYRLNAQATDYLDDEQRLVAEAKGAAADAAAEATTRRSEYAARYVDNGFERLDSLSHGGEPWPGETFSEAVAVIEHYLDTLWLDHATVNDARNRLAELVSTQRRSDLVSIASAVRVFEGPGDPQGTFPAAADVDAQRSRLRIERHLLREAPDSAT